MATTAKQATVKRRKRAQQQQLKLEQFSLMQGMNTQEKRSGIEPGFWSWLMNLQPIGKHTLRALMGKGTDVYTLVGDTITNGVIVVIGNSYYALLFTLAGAAYQINLATHAATTIGTAGTFYGGSGQYPHAVNFGNSGAVIISPLGYWAWDGTTLFSAGAEAPAWLSGNASPISTAGTATNASPTITALSTTVGLAAGMADFSGHYIPASATIKSVDSSSQVTMSSNFTGVTGSYTFDFDWPMPSGITGTAVEIYNASVWYVTGRTIAASAPSNGANFATSAGGVSVPVKDNYVQAGYYGLKQLDGFLYLFAAGAVDVISDVQTTGSPPTTTFLRVNVSPSVGTPWRDSVAGLPSSIVVANPIGVFEVSGGQVRKVSDAFDGIFEEATFPVATADPSGFHPSGAVMSLSEIYCYGLTLSVPDPDDTTNTFVPSLGIWDGRRWFLGSQETNAEVLLGQNAESVATPWISTGTTLYNGFSVASSTLAKKAKSWFSTGDSGILFRKAIARTYAQFGNTTSSAPFSEFNIDTEAGSFPAPQQGGNVTWINNAGHPVGWLNNSGDLVQWNSSSLIIGSLAQIIGSMFGVTIRTVQNTLDIIGLFVAYTDYSERA